MTVVQEILDMCMSLGIGFGVGSIMFILGFLFAQYMYRSKGPLWIIGEDYD